MSGVRARDREQQIGRVWVVLQGVSSAGGQHVSRCLYADQRQLRYHQVGDAAVARGRAMEANDQIDRAMFGDRGFRCLEVGREPDRIHWVEHHVRINRLRQACELSKGVLDPQRRVDRCQNGLADLRIVERRVRLNEEIVRYHARGGGDLQTRRQAGELRERIVDRHGIDRTRLQLKYLLADIGHDRNLDLPEERFVAPVVVVAFEHVALTALEFSQFEWTRARPHAH